MHRVDNSFPLSFYRNYKMNFLVLLVSAVLASFLVVECIGIGWGGGTGLGLLALKGLLLKGAAIGYAIGSSNRRRGGSRGRGFRRGYRKGYTHGHSHGHGYSGGCGGSSYGCGGYSSGYSSGCGGSSYGCGGYSRWRREVRGDSDKLTDMIFQAEVQVKPVSECLQI